MWDGRPFKKDVHVPMFHDAPNGDRRTIDVGREGNAFAHIRRWNWKRHGARICVFCTWP